jgi:hypothetical protein
MGHMRLWELQETWLVSRWAVPYSRLAPWRALRLVVVCSKDGVIGTHVRRGGVHDGRQLFRENAKSIAFRCMDRKEGFCTSPRKGEHPTVQLNPKRLA